MSAVPDQHWTPETYLAYERSTSERSEYFAGRIYAMAGASVAHNLILGNTLASLHGQLRTRPCQVYPSDMRLKVTPVGLYTYPDLSVVCGEPHFEDSEVDTLLNPTILVEVLSPSTEAYDRGRKFQHYRHLASLQEYLLIAQDSIRVEHYVRQPDDQWLLSDVARADATISLPSIQCSLLLADLYEKVEINGDES